MAARNKQVALASSYPPAVNTKVPIFLQKLFKIVSDPSTNDEICWSESGDSFFVHDQERLSKILGHWFKHNKFASFVRQLNMYGFHKIPHLQQGVLKSDSDAERSQFAHPDFHRDQEDRLIFIERKKQAASNGKAEQGIVDFPTVPAQPVTQAPTDPSTGQALDIHAIVSGIAAIRRHQSNISTELNELKRSNQMLWQESMDARSRHQKQQDTINRIVKFLAGVFGQHGTSSPGGKDQERGPSPHSVLRSSRLMIEDKKRDNNVPKVGIVEVQDEEAASPISRGESPYPFASIETPASTTAPSPVPTELYSLSAVTTPRFELPSPTSELPPATLSAVTTPRFELPSPTSELPPATLPDTPASPHNSIISTQPRYPGTDTAQQEDGLPFSPSRSPAIDERIQAALNFLTPGDIQQLFNSLSTHMPAFSSDSVDLNSLQQGAQSNQLPSTSSSQTVISSKPPFDFGSLSSPQIPDTQGTTLNGVDDLISFDAPYMDQWDKASDIEKEVDSMNDGIDELIHKLGLDPSLIANAEVNQTGGNDLDASVLDTSFPSAGIPTADPATQDDLFNSFLNTFSSPESNGNSNVGGGLDFGDDSMGSINPVTPFEESPAETIAAAAASAGLGMNTRAQKRKSDAATELATQLEIPSGPKLKRRKDK